MRSTVSKASQPIICACKPMNCYSIHIYIFAAKHCKIFTAPLDSVPQYLCMGHIWPLSGDTDAIGTVTLACWDLQFN
jgi:hypothetical protein